ncbi:MAG: S41 family peptidase [Phycisphaerales bacterium]
MKRISGYGTILSAAVVLLGSAVAGAATTTVEDRGVLARWSDEVWSTAINKGADSALELLETLPEHPEAGPFRDGLDRYRTHALERDEARQTRLAELESEMTDHVAASDILEGLRAANEIYQLAESKDAVLKDAEVVALVDEANRRARQLEQEGKWLDAHSHYNLLHLLYYDQMTYKEDLTRVLQRLQMLALYMPERLHDLRSDQRVADGEDPLPPYNGAADDWRDKLRPVDMEMVLRAVSYAQQAQVDGAEFGPMLIGGFQAVHTMVTTPDLSEAFPSLEDDQRRRDFLKFVDERMTFLKRNQDRLDFQDLYNGLKDLRSANRSSIDVSYEALLHEFGNGAMNALDDFTGIVWPYDMERFTRTTSGEFKGVGIQITLDEAMQLKVVTPLQGTPAAKAGIRPGDLIREIDGESTVGISLTQAVDQITGDVGTTVTLGIERVGEDETIPVELRRTVIPIHSVKGWKRSGRSETDWDWFIDPENHIGYVRLSQFTKNTSTDLINALREMNRDDLNGLILDLRWNPGGLLDEAVNIVSLFVDSRQVVVTQRDADGVTRDIQKTRRSPVRLDEDLPVVVLVNGGSASASEIVAGCLQDYKKAVVIGERSFGKGSVQNVFPLSGDRARFKLTTQYYYLPSGRLIHRKVGSSTWGIEPDIAIEALPSQVSDALALRQNADVVDFDDDGKLVEVDVESDPAKLLSDGLDPQLETAVLLVQSQLLDAAPDPAARTSLN